MRFEHRMSDADALMWNIEKDPMLRSTITSVFIFDRPIDRDALTDRIDRVTRVIPRLRQRVRSNPLSIAPPRWEVDPHFDLGFHLWWLKAPPAVRVSAPVAPKPVPAPATTGTPEPKGKQAK